MSKKLIFATTNEGKMKEIRMILADLGMEILSLKDMNINVDIEENGKTFEENAIIKAKAICELTGEMVLADDSGLEVDYMDKAPGVYSARYLGEDTPYSVKNQTIIDNLKDAKGEERSARFVCAIAAAFPDGRVLTTQATIEGYIGYEEKGTNGFGYDPLMYVPEYDMTTGQMEPEMKNKISHRGKALELMKEKLGYENINC
ncbi:MAG: XTP/dITP diphosphatase [Lachnospiraceae bacterium]|nr:XTP/dITP diphosphatase [Lachnospiraceae bacterium]MBQ5917901.1 XTP/dITP diphosphatase [Lachnospiraceae bacterium]MEE0686666.1 XTP/dITP diphosphatase [Lachnospiraceae bacterium]MEE0861649.1 XTP/dITP diphosphatase [Lachnospiraceae bacterium]